MLLFENRTDAGQQLAKKLSAYAERDDVVILGLPRGGVPVAYEVAQALHAPLDIFLVRKLGLPGHEELAMGAIASGGVRVLNEGVVRALEISDAVIETVTAQEQQELERRERVYRGDQARPVLANRTVILIDDGLATGATMRAAVAAVRTQEPARVIIAVPTAAPQSCEALKEEVDEIICITTPEPFGGIGAWYRDFSQTSDEEVRTLLERAAKSMSTSVAEYAPG